jgi:rubrerythrin
MQTEYTDKKRKHWWSNDSPADEHDEDRPKTATVTQEVKHLRRVIKRGEKALKHRSEALENEKVTDKELEITREVLEGIPVPPRPSPAVAAVPRIPSFNCFSCGERIPRDSVRCPGCSVLYVQDPTGEAVDESQEPSSEPPLGDECVGIVKEGTTWFVHFDPTSSVVTYLRTDEEDTDFGLECRNCGTVTQFDADRCPVCGHSFDDADTGLVGLLEGLKFDLDNDKELDCPSCGEHIVVESGRCPSCKEMIRYSNPRSGDAGVIPVLRESDIVFVHLDAWNGDLWFAQKMKLRKADRTESVHLDSVSKVAFEHDWQSLARI